MTETIAKLRDAPGQGASPSVTYWRVEGSLLEVGAMRLVGFFTWNAQSFSERWARRVGMAAMALSRPFAYAASRTFATRLLHTLLRGVSKDRLDLLGEECFPYVLKPQLRHGSVAFSGCAAVRAAGVDRQWFALRTRAAPETAGTAWLEGLRSCCSDAD